MSVPSRLVPRMRAAYRAAHISRPFVTTSPARKQDEWAQKTPLGAYYESILNVPSPLPFDQKPEEPPNSADPEVLPEGKKPVQTTPPEPEPRPAKKKPGRPKKTAATSAESSTTTVHETTTSTQTAQEKARIIFGTRLAGPDDVAARMANKASKSSVINGIRVPPQPEEPDNCCMSGCVNCVWELFREDMEEWKGKVAEAEAAGSPPSAAAEQPKAPLGGVGVGDVKIAKDLWDDGAFQNVPVGIREFMKQEKRLKERHEREGTTGSG